MFRKYEKTFRIMVPDIQVPGKLVLDKTATQALLMGKVLVEEKIDGANVGIIRHKTGFHLQKRGSLVGTSEHAQFQYFHNWANVQNWEKVMALPIGTILYGELAFAKHTVFYNKLPDYFLAFDVFDTKADRWYSYEERKALCDSLGFKQVPLISQGFVRKEDLSKLIPAKSAYGEEPAEGIVLKRYTKGGKLQAKLVRPEFIKHMEENDHWMHQQFTQNVLESK
jgi:ATP-dependent RNA circularization protein (DNA/RNA ligase family)